VDADFHRQETAKAEDHKMSVDSKRVTEAQVRSELTRMDGSIA
jgi:hypothetical protein